MQAQDEGLEALRKIISFLYREVGVLNSRNHPQIAKRRRLKSGFFATTQRKTIARELYWRTCSVDDPSQILRFYEEVTGLSLAEVEKAFGEGNWQNSRGQYTYGGPKWAAIAKTAIELKSALASDDYISLDLLLAKVPKLEHNHGRLIDKFFELGVGTRGSQ